MIKPTIQYLAACYQAENHSTNVWNIFSKDCIATHMLNSAEAEQTFALPEKVFFDFFEHTKQYHREREIVIASHFIVGNISLAQFGKKVSKELCAPLTFTPAELVNNANKYQARSEPELTRFNEPLIAILFEDKKLASDFKSLLISNERNQGNAIEEYLKTHCEQFEELISASDCNNAKTTQEFLERQPKERLFLLPESAISIIEKSKSYRGIFDELSKLSEKTSFSPPLQAILEPCYQPEKTTVKTNTDIVPGLLSEQQKCALKLAAENTVGVVQGPPGTGKSYTIAAIALERVLAGESVLIAGQSEDALSVIQQKLKDELHIDDDILLRTGGSGYKSKIRSKIKAAESAHNNKQQHPLAADYKSNHHTLVKAEKNLSSCFQQASKDGYKWRNLSNIIHKQTLWQKFIYWRLVRKAEKAEPLYQIVGAFQHALRERNISLGQHIEAKLKTHQRRAVKRNKSTLQNFKKAIGARNSGNQANYFIGTDFKKIVDIFPLWLSTLESLHQYLPLEDSIFDLVIIDEATQCDIASSLPAIFRAKRVLIVGDKKQLRHISFLPSSEEEKLKQHFQIEEIDLSYRRHSLIDAEHFPNPSSAHEVKLIEHFRSYAELIQFSNHYFYESALRIMTEKPGHKHPEALKFEVVANAKRTRKVNKVEAERICDELANIIRLQQELPQNLCSSVGVISFFRDQSDYLETLIYKRFSIDALRKHQVRIATPYKFQGDERDIVLLSCSIDSSTKHNTLRYINREDVFNVAITRARKKQIVYLSLPPEELPSDNLLSKYFYDYTRRAAKTPERFNAALPDLHMGEHAKRLCSALTEKGYSVLHGVNIAGIDIDITISNGQDYLAIDLIGFSSSFEAGNSLEHYKVLQRCGLTLMPISLLKWCTDESAILAKVDELMQQLAKVRQPHVSRISQQNWLLLEALETHLCKKLRTIEQSMITYGLHAAIEQLKALIENFANAHWILNQRLSPEELTYIRYSNALLLTLTETTAVLEELVVQAKQLNLQTQHDAPATPPEPPQASLDTIKQACAAIQQITQKWQATPTSVSLNSNALDSAIQDLHQLTERVDNYHSPPAEKQ